MTVDDRSVMTDDGSVISFFRIAHDLLANSVLLSGDTYNKAGHITGHWNSTMTRVYPNENKILYLWKGQNSEASIAYVPLHGLGEIEFVRSSDTTQGMTHGRGMFWKVNEAHPAKTFANGIQLRPVTKKGVISTMTSGKANDIRTLVMQTLAEW